MDSPTSSFDRDVYDFGFTFCINFFFGWASSSSFLSPFYKKISLEKATIIIWKILTKDEQFKVKKNNGNKIFTRLALRKRLSTPLRIVPRRDTLIRKSVSDRSRFFCVRKELWAEILWSFWLRRRRIKRAVPVIEDRLPLNGLSWFLWPRDPLKHKIIE